MVLLPHDAHHASVHISTPVNLRVAIRERYRHLIELSKHNSRRYEIEQDNYLKYERNAPQNLQIIEVDSNVIDIKEERYRWEGAVVAAGTLMRWNMTDTDIYISANSKLQADLVIMVSLVCFSVGLVTLSSKCFSSKDRKTKPAIMKIW